MTERHGDGIACAESALEGNRVETGRRKRYFRRELATKP